MQKEKAGNGKVQTGINLETKRAFKIFDDCFKIIFPTTTTIKQSEMQLYQSSSFGN